MHQLSSSLGNYQLSRYPASHDKTLLPWDSADLYLIEKITAAIPKGSRILIANDEFGGLTTVLSNHYKIVHWSDSYLAQVSAQKNLLLNQQIVNSIKWLSSTESTAGLHFDLIIVRPTKNINYTNYQLQLLSYHHSGTKCYVGVMQKFISKGLKKTLELNLSKLNPGRAQKKAKVIEGEFSHSKQLPEQYQYYKINDLSIANMANVFSGSSVDIGARFLIDNFPSVDDIATIADVGCGNGILSIYAAQSNPNMSIFGFDESYMAVASAQKTFSINNKESAVFSVNNCLSGIQQNFDIILCNPPFHQNRRVTTDTAHQMIKQAKQRLNSNGELWVVANRHLQYHKQLLKHFGNQTLIRGNNKFVILKAENC
ncbi:MAG: methyltransferase [Kangiellaceae bacterium]|jgi:16S rRNA G1207 methylase RsmC|nr:methyltransferase [Kangiellaceae bacterium]